MIGLSFLLLLLAFRSILVPLKATLGFLLTIGATFGITVGVFQNGWGASLLGVDSPGPLVSFLPIIMMGILFGLAMDYEVFIVSRVREEFVHGKHATEATIQGVGHGARVVTAAALIMAAVFAGFILVEDPIIKTIGFGLTIGVLIDAFVVRMAVVPAVLSLLGDRAWYFPQVARPNHPEGRHRRRLPPRSPEAGRQGTRPRRLTQAHLWRARTLSGGCRTGHTLFTPTTWGSHRPLGAHTHHWATPTTGVHPECQGLAGVVAGSLFLNY